MKYNFQQWMSRLAHRWRTLRTAIRNANCTIQWVIEILNAYCTSGLFLGVCLYQCPNFHLGFLFLNLFLKEFNQNMRVICVNICLLKFRKNKTENTHEFVLTRTDFVVSNCGNYYLQLTLSDDLLLEIDKIYVISGFCGSIIGDSLVLSFIYCGPDIR